jgi:hypothetical protein
MNVQETQVKEFRISFESLPGTVFKIHAETQDKALKKLLANFRAITAEVQSHKGQTKTNQPTA